MAFQETKTHPTGVVEHSMAQLGVAKLGPELWDVQFNACRRSSTVLR